jgi:hypothetical protein
MNVGREGKWKNIGSIIIGKQKKAVKQEFIELIVAAVIMAKEFTIKLLQEEMMNGCLVLPGRRL